MNKVANINVDSILKRTVNTYACQVMDLTPLSTHTFQIKLQVSDDQIVDYQAGQYLQLKLDVNKDGQQHALSYSIANNFVAKQPRRLQLFIQKNSDFSDKILQRLVELHNNNETIDVVLPMGQAFLQTDLNLTHLLVAAGSGISKIKCLAQEMLRQQPETDINIYWSNRHIDDFYLLDEFKNWVDQNKHLSFTPILESADDNWQGRSGFIYKVIKEDFNTLDQTQVYLCGSPQMVYGTLDQLRPIGLKEENCYSDVFEYAPRS